MSGSPGFRICVEKIERKHLIIRGQLSEHRDKKESPFGTMLCPSGLSCLFMAPLYGLAYLPMKSIAPVALSLIR